MEDKAISQTPEHLKTKVAVVLLNLGGTDSLSAVRPFLFNLFYDPAILRIPNPFRYILAQIISRSRNKKAQGIYRQMGGSSPLLPNTQRQARALKESLAKVLPGVEIFISMRCWHPFTEEAVQAVKNFQPDKVILLPLYPQFSTTTTQSSFQEWERQSKKLGLNHETVMINDYHDDADFIAAHVELLLPAIKQAYEFCNQNNTNSPRILFSAHSLPQKVIDDGDPYERQTIKSVDLIVAKVQGILNQKLDVVLCYQSKVGPIKWLSPTTEDEIIRAGKDGVPVIVVPISFVSDHSETLVELDDEYRQLADESGVPFYNRVPVLDCNQSFIKCLINKVLT